MEHEVELVTTVERPTAVVARETTWAEFPTLWKTLLDQVYAFLATSEVRQEGHNVMLYLDDRPSVEVGVEVNGPFTGGSDPVVPVRVPARRAGTVPLDRRDRGKAYDGLGVAHEAGLDLVPRTTGPSSPTRDPLRTVVPADLSTMDAGRQMATEIYWSSCAGRSRTGPSPASTPKPSPTPDQGRLVRPGRVR